MDKTTIEIMKLAQSLASVNERECDRKSRGVILGVYFNDYEGRPSIQLGESGDEWGERYSRDEELDEIVTDVFGVKIFSLVRHEEKEAGERAEMAV